MKFNIISNISNGLGLQRDYYIMREELEARGHEVAGVQFNDEKAVAADADVNLFIEVVEPRFFPAAKRQWVMPNPEWWLDKYTDHLPQFEKVLCKTLDCFRIFEAMVGPKAVFVGFHSRDLQRPGTPKELRFLHVAGNSAMKNSEAVIEAWKKHRIPYPLTVLTTVPLIDHLARSAGANVDCRWRVGEDELIDLMNRCAFHLCPSRYEGFGHYIHEGLSAGAIVITTDAPPMNEYGIPKTFLLSATLDGTLRLASLYSVSADAVAEAVMRLAALPEDERARMSSESRARYDIHASGSRTLLGWALEEAVCV